jgi:hypothetical protein
MDVWIEVFGWIGSGLLIVSLLQSRMLVLRVINSIASAMLVLYNVLVETWPMVAMNAAVILINAWHIAKITRERRASQAAEAETAA